MAQAKRDQNDIPVALGVNSSDLSTPLMFKIDPITNRWLIKINSTTATATSATKNKRDQNDKPTMYGVSSVDGITLVPIQTDSNGNLLVTLS